MNRKEFDLLYQDLVKKITADEEARYSPIVLDEYHHPHYFGTLSHPTAEAKIKGSCGDTMNFQIIVKKNIINNVSFWTDGCGASIACGNMLSKLIVKKTINDAQNISSKQLLLELGGLPDEHRHCANLAIKTVRKCLTHAIKEKEEGL